MSIYCSQGNKTEDIQLFFCTTMVSAQCYIIEAVFLLYSATYAFYLLPLSITKWQQTKDTHATSSAIILVLVAGLVLDNFCLGTTRVLRHVGVSMVLHYFRYFVHYTVLPCCLLCLADFAGLNTKSNMYIILYVLLAAMILVGLVEFKVLVLNYEQEFTGYVLTKREAHAPLPLPLRLLASPIPPIFICILTIYVGYVQQSWPLLIGGIVEFVVNGVPASSKGLKGMYMNLGEIFFMYGFIATAYAKQ